MELWVIGVTDGCDVGVEIFFFLIYKAAEVFFVLTVVLQLRKLQKMAEQLAKGDLNSRMDTTGLLWEFKKHGDYLNQISDGMIKAVDERIKSEHFKTELITNVSHDIKTPLTSIINYVDCGREGVRISGSIRPAVCTDEKAGGGFDRSVKGFYR